ncbi:MAG: hypothetical protein MAG715_01222 [Methanonatronarchaeales archaeon]|nr:hypothetical protein [Methanonatronarchaeales archaeon]
MPPVDDLRNWVKRNPGLALLVLIGAILVLGTIGVLLSSFGFQAQHGITEPSVAPDEFRDAPETTDVGGGEFVQVKEARIRAEADDAEADASRVRDLASGYGGYVEHSSKHEPTRTAPSNSSQGSRRTTSRASWRWSGRGWKWRATT